MAPFKRGMAPAPNRELVRQQWSDPRRIAAWRKWEPLHRLVTRSATLAIIEAAHAEPGMSVLDLASGSGEPALALAEAVGPSGHVTSTDLVPEMLGLAEETARPIPWRSWGSP